MVHNKVQGGGPPKDGPVCPLATMKKKKLTSRFFILLSLTFMGIAVIVYFSQERKLDEIRKEQEELSLTYQELLNEQQRIEYMIEYAQSEEYLLQYAREKLGYVYDNELKFHISD